MHPEQVCAWISNARLQNFLDACGQDRDRAIALYEWNAEVSGAFLVVLHHLEVLLRNAIDRQFPRSAEAELVAIWAPTVWLTDPTVIQDEGRERVNDAITRLTRTRRRETRDRVVAALSFGFWSALFTSRYDDLWRSHLHRAFPNGDGRRRQVNDLVQRIGNVRNRIAHHEAVFSFDLEREHDLQLQLAGLIDADARAHIEGLSPVPVVLARRPV